MKLLYVIWLSCFRSKTLEGMAKLIMACGPETLPRLHDLYMQLRSTYDKPDDALKLAVPAIQFIYAEAEASGVSVETFLESGSLLRMCQTCAHLYEDECDTVCSAFEEWIPDCRQCVQEEDRLSEVCFACEQNGRDLFELRDYFSGH